MATPDWSEISTQGIHVKAGAFYLADESNPDEERFVFGYRIVITNQTEQPVKLISRYWLIIDAQGQDKEVKGTGVVGQTPTIDPGQSFEYTSFCPLETDWGTMEGSYQLSLPDGTTIDAKIARFYLRLRTADLSISNKH